MTAEQSGDWALFVPAGEGLWRASRRKGNHLQVLFADSRARLERKMAIADGAEDDREINKGAPPPGAWRSLPRKEKRRNEATRSTRSTILS